MNKFQENLSFICLLIGALFLPWQTKFIWLTAPSNYWEISFFAAIFFIFFFIFFLLANRVYRYNLKIIFQKEFIFFFIIFIFLLFAFISSFVSPLPILSLYCFFLLLLAILFFYCLRLIPSPWRLYFITFILLSLTIQALIGIGQFVTQFSLASSWLGMASHNAGDLGTAVIETINGRWLRAYGASDHPNIFGGLMTIGILISLYIIQQKKFLKYRPLLLVLSFLFLVALLFSFSRTAFLALLIGLSLMIWENRQFWLRSHRFLIFYLIFFLFLSLFFIWQYNDLFFSRFNFNNRLEQISTKERLYFNQRAWQDFKKSPLFGTGLGASTFFAYKNSLDYGQSNLIWKYQPAHNYWLLAATESGLIFVFALIFIWLIMYKKSQKNHLLGLWLAIFILTLFDHWLFSLPLSVFWVFALFALMW